MVVIVIMYVYSLRVGELGFPTLLSTWFLGNYFPYRITEYLRHPQLLAHVNPSTQLTLLYIALILLLLRSLYGFSSGHTHCYPSTALLA